MQIFTQLRSKSGIVFGHGVRSLVHSFLPSYNCGYLPILTKLEIQKDESMEKVLGFIILSYGPTQICKIIIHSHAKVLG